MLKVLRGIKKKLNPINRVYIYDSYWLLCIEYIKLIPVNQEYF